MTVSKGVLDSTEIVPVDLIESFERYLRGDWGLVSSDKHLENDIALTGGGRVEGLYSSELGAVFVMMTEGEHTWIGLPSECEYLLPVNSASSTV